MPDRDWPPLQRWTARVLRTASYALATGAAAWVLADPPSDLLHGPHAVTATATALAGIVAGAVATVAAAAHNWAVEWVSVIFLGTAFLVYGVLEGITRDGASAAALQMVGLLLLTRAVDLWVFSTNARRAREHRVRKWRRTAGLEL